MLSRAPDTLTLMACSPLPTEFDALQAILAPASRGSAGSERVWGVSGERSSGERGRELRDHLTPVTGGRAETLHLGDMSIMTKSAFWNQTDIHLGSSL